METYLTRPQLSKKGESHAYRFSSVPALFGDGVLHGNSRPHYGMCSQNTSAFAGDDIKSVTQLSAHGIVCDRACFHL